LEDLVTADALGSKMPVAKAEITGKRMKARAIAREWIRNGMNARQAYKTVTGFEPQNKNLNQMMRGCMDDFVDELRGLVEASKVDQTAVLNMLWELIHISILDYFDDDGNVMPVRELKKLSRVHQSLIDQIKVVTSQKPVYDKDGKVMVDDNGRPYLQTEQAVEIKLPPKLLAVDQLAKIMKWVGPAVVINNHTTNVAMLMQEKDNKMRQLESMYGDKIIEGEVVRPNSG
jgi:hypothetical protein